MIHQLTAIGMGAVLGAWSRWGLSLLLNPLFLGIPLGTLAANLIGAYLIGASAGFFLLHTEIPPTVKLFVITGFLGGMTTFSGFSIEFFERLAAGQYHYAFLLTGAHVLGSLFMTWLGVISVGAQNFWN